RGDFYLSDADTVRNLQVPGGHTMTPVIWNTLGFAPVSVVKPNAGWRPATLAGTVGAGHLIFSVQDSGCAINDYVGGVNVGYGGNSAAISGEALIAAAPVDLKFVYNMANWSSANSTSFSDVRRSGGADEKIGAVLADKWSTTVPT